MVVAALFPVQLQGFAPHRACLFGLAEGGVRVAERLEDLGGGSSRWPGCGDRCGGRGAVGVAEAAEQGKSLISAAPVVKVIRPLRRSHTGGDWSKPGARS